MLGMVNVSFSVSPSKIARGFRLINSLFLLILENVVEEMPSTTIVSAVAQSKIFSKLATFE